MDTKAKKISGRERLRYEATANGSNRDNGYGDGYGSHRGVKHGIPSFFTFFKFTTAALF